MKILALAVPVTLAGDGPTSAGEGNGRSGASAAASTGGDDPSAGPQGGHVTPDGAKLGIASGSN
jgi:hypothetical protein